MESLAYFTLKYAKLSTSLLMRALYAQRSISLELAMGFVLTLLYCYSLARLKMNGVVSFTETERGEFCH